MRLVDQFEDARRELGLELLAEIDVCGQFGDVWWPPLPRLDELTVLSTTDLRSLAPRSTAGESLASIEIPRKPR